MFGAAVQYCKRHYTKSPIVISVSSSLTDVV